MLQSVPPSLLLAIPQVFLFPSAVLQVGGPALAVIDHPDKGPQFGAEGLTIPLDGTRSVKTRLGPFYAKLPTGESVLFPDQEGRGRRTAAAQLQSLKVAPTPLVQLLSSTA